MKVYVVKQPEGAYDGYTETVVKVFIDKKKVVNYVKEENSKKPFEQSKKCEDCEYKWCYNEKLYKSKPSCFMGDDSCEPYFEKYIDVQEMFFEEYDVEDFADYTKQVRKEVLGELMNMLGDRAELIDFGNGCAEFMFTTYDLQECSKVILDQIQGETK